ncbi:hypothetical protein ACFSMW_09015 [Virgibacillus halophilus]|uniref:Permuted papain-like amidase enzyme, YaeF/YiiX, C92 family n=1 Tax=Tigheibacillus halophilus TaxID=361280 RepID=A0ABU5C4R4_9BACI|nr:hypothetical protein [Virgibacillus halophilus]
MGERMIYFIFTDTGTCLSKVINLFTRCSLNHVSIGFDDALTKVYSFGRKKPKNPFSGGFVRENIRGDFLKKADCAIYSFCIEEAEYEKLLHNISAMEAEQGSYRYNFLGLIGVLLQIEIKRENAFFCSQFVAMMLKDSLSFQLAKPCCFITPADIRGIEGLCLQYEGRLGDYATKMIQDAETSSAFAVNERKSRFVLLSQKIKRLVLR